MTEIKPLAIGRFHQFPDDEDGPGDWEWFDRGISCDSGCVDAVIVSQADFDALVKAAQASEAK